MRTLLLSKSDESYLEKCALERKFAYGIIIGHQAEPEKTIVVHLARNNEEDGDFEDLSDLILNIGDINAQVVTNQWISASKMCAGSFQIIGIFVSSVESDIVDEHSADFKHAKRMFNDVNELLMKSGSFNGPTTDGQHSEYIFLAYSTQNKVTLCKSYVNKNGGSFSPMDYRYVSKKFEWITVECNYDVDDVYPILDIARRINIEAQFHNTIEDMRNSLCVSEIFIQNENVEDDLELQAYIKKKKQQLEENDNVLSASIFMPVKFLLSKNAPLKVGEYIGTIRLTGAISSRIYCSPRNTLGDVKRFLRDDILRSLAARIQVYCDGLTEPHVSNDAIFISEPPRRVYFNLPTAEGAEQNPVQFSEYIFRGEAPQVAVAQAKQILDIDINAETICFDYEGLPDDDNLMAISSSSENSFNKSSVNKFDLTHNMYLLGITVALLVLVMSVGLHYAYITSTKST